MRRLVTALLFLCLAAALAAGCKTQKAGIPAGMDPPTKPAAAGAPAAK